MLISFLKILNIYAFKFISKDVNKFTNGKPNCAVLKKEIKMCMDVMPKSKHSKSIKTTAMFFIFIYKTKHLLLFNNI